MATPWANKLWRMNMRPVSAKYGILPLQGAYSSLNTNPKALLLGYVINGLQPKFE
jgi:hypothetical protein